MKTYRAPLKVKINAKDDTFLYKCPNILSLPFTITYIKNMKVSNIQFFGEFEVFS